MAKTSTFQCSNCSYQTPKWQGKCPNCNEWNTLTEVMVSKAVGKGRGVSQAGSVVALQSLGPQEHKRVSSQSPELDAVLGGGFVPGSLILLGGDPGIGKSTLALQVALALEHAQKKVLYVSGEESPHQLQLRARRIAQGADLSVLAETDLDVVLGTLASLRPEFAIIDSIQTLRSESVNGVVGGVSQITFATNQLLSLCKQQHTTVLIIGHVTKEGFLAGPKTLEHMVDVVLYLEGERFGSLRLLRSTKNRFGAAGEVGVFEMTEKGMRDVANASSLFLEHRDKPLVGSCTTAIMEGNKVLLLEVQALVSTSSFGYPKRTTSGFDVNRLQLIVAILQKVLKLKLDDQDIYVNVAGGFKLDERAADLPVALAILSSYKNAALPAQSLAFGEVGLLGELRAVSQVDKRLREAEKLGFEQVLVAGNQKSSSGKKLAVQNVTEIKQLLRWLE